MYQIPETSDRKRNPRMPEKQTHGHEKDWKDLLLFCCWWGKTHMSA